MRPKPTGMSGGGTLPGLTFPGDRERVRATVASLVGRVGSSEDLWARSVR